MRARLTEWYLLLHTLILSTVGGASAAHAAQLTGDATGSVPASWAPDSSKIAFILAEDDGRDGLYIANCDGSKLQVLFKGQRFQDVAWAPDGERVAVGSAPRGAEAVIHIVDVYGDGRDSVALGQPARNVALGWSADSTRIVVQADLSILLVRLDDKSTDSLDNVNPPVCRVFFNGGPPLSPDNKLLLAAGPVNPLASMLGCRTVGTEKSGEPRDLYAWLVKVEGERYTLPVMQYGSLAGPPVWAPNGRTIAFITRTATGRFTTDPTGAFWMNMVSDVGMVRIEAKRVIDPLSMMPVLSPTGDNVGYFWRDATGKCFLNIVNVAFTTVLPLQMRLKRVLVACWNEEASMFVVAVTAGDETVCVTLDLLSGELDHLATLSEPFGRLLPSPDLSKLLLATKRRGKLVFAVLDVETGTVLQLHSKK